jgi:hypothetical protein
MGHTHTRFLHTGHHQCMWGNWTVGTGQNFCLSKIQIPWGFYLFWCLRGHLCKCGKTVMTSSSFLHTIQYSIYLIIQCNVIINDNLGEVGILYLHTKLRMFCKHIFLKSEDCKGALSCIRVGMVFVHITLLPWLFSGQPNTLQKWSNYDTQQFMQKVKLKDTSRMKLQNFG